MNKKFISLSIIAISAFTLILMSSSVKSETHEPETLVYVKGQYPVLNLNLDPVDPNGVSPQLAQQLMSQGYTQANLPQDVIADVSFKNAAGNLYIRTGLIPAGTSVWVKPGTFGDLTDESWRNTDEIVLAVCSNVYLHWRWQVRAYS